MTTNERCKDMEFDPAQVVARYLESKGYDILERGWSCPEAGPTSSQGTVETSSSRWRPKAPTTPSGTAP